MPNTLLLILLGIAVIAIIVLVIKNAQVQRQMNQMVREEVARWRQQELDGLREQLELSAHTSAQAKALADLELWRIEEEEKIRSDASKRSSAVTIGKVTEHLAPYLLTFPFNPKDARFLGAPIDLIVFDGLSEDEVREIIFLEVKTGGSTLSGRERSVRDAVKEGRVSWQEFRVGE